MAVAILLISRWRRVHRLVVNYTKHHGGTHVRIFSHLPIPLRDTHLRIFSRLSASSLTIAFTLALPTSTVNPTPTPPSDHPPRVTHPMIFPPLYHHFIIFLKRWSLTSNVTPTPISPTDSPPRFTYPTIFSRLSTNILTFP